MSQNFGDESKKIKIEGRVERMLIGKGVGDGRDLTNVTPTPR